MKTKLLLWTCALTLLTSCELTETIYDTPSVTDFVRTKADAQGLVSGTYGLLISPNLFKDQTMQLLFLTADDVSANTGGWATIGQKAYGSSVNQINTTWNGLYAVINNANTLLEKIPSLALDPADQNSISGDLYFLRALAYFYLVRFFGEIPLSTEATSVQSDFFQARSSVDQVYAQIFSDFQRASVRLPLRTRQPALEVGHGTKGAAQALLSKAYLTYGNHAERTGSGNPADAFRQAKLYADSVLTSGQYTLLPDFGNLWQVDKEKEAYQEVVYGLSFTRDLVQSLAASKGSEYPLRFLPTTMPNVTGRTPLRNGFSHFKIQPWFFEFCTSGDYAGDYRAEKSFLLRWQNTTGKTTVTYPLIPQSTDVSEDSPYLFKYVDGQGVDQQNHENDLFLIRLAEVYLIKAEAENELNGPSAEAYTAFNRVRERARRADGTARKLPADLATGLTKDQFRQKVFEERSVELVGEGHRWFDLVRMKAPNGKTQYEYQFGTALPLLAKGLPKYDAPSKTWKGGRTEATNLPAYNARYLRLPIPSNELNVNPNLQQNPGW